MGQDPDTGSIETAVTLDAPLTPVDELRAWPEGQTSLRVAGAPE